MGKNVTKKDEGKKDTVAVKVELSRPVHQELRIKCIRTGQTIQQVIEYLVSEWVKKSV